MKISLPIPTICENFKSFEELLDNMSFSFLDYIKQKQEIEK